MVVFNGEAVYHEYAIHVLCISSKAELMSHSTRFRCSFSQCKKKKKKKTLTYLWLNLVCNEKPRLSCKKCVDKITNF